MIEDEYRSIPHCSLYLSLLDVNNFLVLNAPNSPPEPYSAEKISDSSSWRQPSLPNRDSESLSISALKLTLTIILSESS